MLHIIFKTICFLKKTPVSYIMCHVCLFVSPFLVHMTYSFVESCVAEIKEHELRHITLSFFNPRRYRDGLRCGMLTGHRATAFSQCLRIVFKNPLFMFIVYSCFL